MSLNTSKKYTVRVHYFNVMTESTSSVEDKDVKFKDIQRIIDNMLESIDIVSEIFKVPLIISSIEVKTA